MLVEKSMPMNFRAHHAICDRLYLHIQYMNVHVYHFDLANTLDDLFFVIEELNSTLRKTTYLIKFHL